MAEFIKEKRKGEEKKIVNYLFPGSFSPVTNAHIGVIVSLLGFKRDIYEKVNVYVIPATNQYNKPSIFLPQHQQPPHDDYLSEDARFKFLTDSVEGLTNGNDSFIISQSDFKYGRGDYLINGTQSKGLMQQHLLHQIIIKK